MVILLSFMILMMVLIMVSIFLYEKLKIMEIGGLLMYFYFLFWFMLYKLSCFSVVGFNYFIDFYLFLGFVCSFFGMFFIF